MAKNEKDNEEADDEDTEDENLDDLDDSTDWKAKAEELQKKHKESGIRNRERTKTLRDKIAQLEKLAAPPIKKEERKSDDEMLERLDKMALQVAGINEADEVELFGKWKEQTGRKADDIVGNSIFKKEIEEIRIAKANLRATSDIKGERGESGVRNTPDYWIAKATKGADGKLMFHDETPKELYSKILDKLQESEPSSSQELKFYNQK